MENNHRRVSRAAAISVWVALVVMALKVYAAINTNSAAAASDAIESVVHICALAFMVYAIRLAHTPADAGHPFGHGKVEFFSVAVESGFVLLAGLLVVIWSGNALISEHNIQDLELGLGLMLTVSLINTVLGWWLIRSGKKMESAIIEADGYHIFGDALTSWAVLVGLGLVYVTGWQWVDAILAGLVGLHLIRTGIRLLRKALAHLMDAADPAILRRVIGAINEIRQDNWYDIHALRVHSVGSQLHVDFHLVVPAEWTIEDAHHISHDVEDHILKSLNIEGSVIVHMDPKKETDHYRELFTVEDATRTDQFAEKRGGTVTM
ncbi:MAG: cation transporter [Planctomycetes bacterium]|nr:cation transporter [Planctomycetota bacterium]